MTTIDCISDLHGEYPQLDGGDLLIIAGDLTTNDKIPAWKTFLDWLENQDYKRKIYIGGNHDNFLTQCCPCREGKIEFLCDSGTEFDGLKIWGSPWTAHFPEMNKNCMAFVKWTDEELDEKWRLFPDEDEIDILITHSPPYGIFDEIDEVTKWGTKQLNVGSKSLLLQMLNIKPKLHVFGHIHQGYGHQTVVWGGKATQFVNASIMNREYEAVNKPIRVIL